MESFDYIIIGAGPGGYETAAGAARQGAKVALIERDLLGGTCLNRGCIPTKTLCHAARIARHIIRGASYGIDTSGMTIDYRRLSARKDEIVSQLRDGIGIMLRDVEVINAEARFTGPRTVVAEGRDMTASKIIIATGSAPASLPIPGSELAVTSDGLLAMTSLPERMVIIGGGVIGMEFASIYNNLGTEVTVIEYCKEILPPFDKDIAKRLRMALSAEGISFYTSAEVTTIEPGVTVRFSHKGNRMFVESDIAVMATGRHPVFPKGLESAGITYDRKGISVNPETFETSATGVYAIGDVNGICMLAHAASAQGRRILGENVNIRVIPSIVFTDPEAAAVGLTEDSCKSSGMDYKSVKLPFRSNGKAVSMGETSGMVKLIAERQTNHVLGCHAVGPHAADIIQEAAFAMTNDLSLEDIQSTIHAHPTISEILPAAASQLL